MNKSSTVRNDPLEREMLRSGIAGNALRYSEEGCFERDALQVWLNLTRVGVGVSQSKET